MADAPVVYLSQILSEDIEAPGIHKRLLAGLQSLADRGKAPEVRFLRRGSSSPDASYADFDIYYLIEVDDTEDVDPDYAARVPPRLGTRVVVGTIEWPIHVTHAGGVQDAGHYDPARFDLTVHSSAQPGEASRFVGELPLASYWSNGTVGAQLVMLGSTICARARASAFAWEHGI